MKPKISVLMPVYNGEKYLNEAIDSILNQTFIDFEFIIIDDGSNDNSVKIIKSYNDSRIKLFYNGTNKGLIYTLNKGLQLAQGNYIARMDADDVSYDYRFDKQLKFMAAYPEIGVCGTWVETSDGQIFKYPITHEDCVVFKFFNSPLAHPTVMMQRDVIVKHKLRYSNDFEICEDMEFWRRCLKYTKLGNVNEPLLLYRVHSNNVSKIKKHLQKKGLISYYSDELLTLGIDPQSIDILLHLAFIRSELTHDLLTRYTFKEFDEWANLLFNHNKQKKVFPNVVFLRFLRERYFNMAVCYLFRLSTVQYYLKSPFSEDTLCLKLLKRYFVIKLRQNRLISLKKSVMT